MHTQTRTLPTSDGAAEFARRPAVLLLGIPLVATILITVIRGSRHFGWDWPTHAHHHLVAHIAGTTGLSAVALLVLFQALRYGQRWAWWALLVTGVAVFGGHWVGNVTVGLGTEAALPNTAQAVLTATYALGLARSVPRAG